VLRLLKTEGKEVRMGNNGVVGPKQRKLREADADILPAFEWKSSRHIPGILGPQEQE